MIGIRAAGPKYTPIYIDICMYVSRDAGDTYVNINCTRVRWKWLHVSKLCRSKVANVEYQEDESKRRIGPIGNNHAFTFWNIYILSHFHLFCFCFSISLFFNTKITFLIIVLNAQYPSKILLLLFSYLTNKLITNSFHKLEIRFYNE